MLIRIALVVTALAFPAAAGAATVEVEILGSAYNPASVTVTAGDTVNWTNKDPVLHTVTSDDGAFQSSGDLGMGQSHPVVFMTAGTYAYHCLHHSFMTGTVTVLAPGTPAPAPELRISDLRLREGDGGVRSAVFTLRLSQASATSVTVGWGTADGTAKRRSDYRARSRTLTIQPGETLKRLTVPVVSDRRDERNETFWLLLHDPTGATLGDRRGRGLIIDDD